MSALESFFDFVLRVVPPKGRIAALRTPREIEVYIARNDFGGWSIYPANEPAQRLFADSPTGLPAVALAEVGNFGTYAAAHQRAADHNCWVVVDEPDLPGLRYGAPRRASALSATSAFQA